MAKMYYEVNKRGQDWAVDSPEGFRHKLYTVEHYGTSEAAFKAATKDCNKLNAKIIKRMKEL
jgi:predicted transcriptional regulator